MTFDTALKAFRGDRALMQKICNVSQSCISGWQAHGTVPHYVQTIARSLAAVDRNNKELAAARAAFRQAVAMLK